MIDGMAKQQRLRDVEWVRMEFRVVKALAIDITETARERGISINAEGTRRLESQKQSNDTNRWRANKGKQATRTDKPTPLQELEHVEIEALPDSRGW